MKVHWIIFFAVLGISVNFSESQQQTNTNKLEEVIRNILGDDPLKTMATLAQKAVSKVGQVVVDKIAKNNAEKNNNAASGTPQNFDSSAFSGSNSRPTGALPAGSPQNFDPSAFFGSNGRPTGAFPAGSSAQSSSAMKFIPFYYILIMLPFVICLFQF